MRKRLSEYIKQFFLIDDTPHKVAAGAALGIFFGIAPGEGVVTTLVFATIFRLNRLAATTGVLATNMWTTLFVLPIAATTGAFVFGENYAGLISQFHQSNGNILNLFISKIFFFDVTLPLFSGFIIVSAAIALVFYGLLIFLLLKYGKNGNKKSHLLVNSGETI